MGRIQKSIILSIISFVFLFPNQLINAQEQKRSKIFKSIGVSLPFLDIIKSPVQYLSYPVPINYTGLIPPNSPSTTTVSENSRLYGVSLVTFSYYYRYNFFEFSDNKAIGFNIIPSIGISYFSGVSDVGTQMKSEGAFRGFGNFNLPFLIEYEFGAGSTSEATRNHGYFFGIGVNYSLIPLIKIPDFQTFSYFQFTISAGYRYMKSSKKLREFNLLLGIGNSYNPPNNQEPEMGGYSFEVRLSYVKFIKTL